MLITLRRSGAETIRDNVLVDGRAALPYIKDIESGAAKPGQPMASQEGRRWGCVLNFKNKRMQAAYDTARNLGNDVTSEFYREGRPRTGASHRVAYWHGRSGITDSLYARAARGTLGYAFYAAGRDERRADKRKGHVCPLPASALGGPIWPKWTPKA